ncbi:MAG TPA: hypothetical protein VK196_05685 [Magnetospirillum sp.]|nr:hypothetical protein [Magnetospirillum sp.]
MAGLREYLPAAVALVFGVCWAGALMAWPRDGQPMAALFLPAANGGVAFARVVNAGADAILGFGVLPGIVVAQSEQPGFSDRLYGNGALIVVRAPAQSDCMR